MKYKLIVIAAIFFAGTVKAQDDNTEGPVHQVGINATTFIKQFLSFNDNTLGQSSPYLVSYKRLNRGKGIRAAAGASHSSTTTNPNNGTPISTTKNLSVDLRAGYEWQKRFDKRWLVYYGGDLSYSYAKSVFQTSLQAGGFPPQTLDAISSSERFVVGGGGVLGIQFNLTNRICFNAETTAYFNYSENRRNDKNMTGIGSRRADYIAGAGFSITLPTSLFFVVTF